MTTALTAAMPVFVAAIVLIGLFAVRLRWFPALGNGSGLLSDVQHLTLPSIALALSSLAIVARVTRAAIREEARKEHVQTAVSRGIPRRQLIRRHILRNAAIPITTISGITIASLIAVAAVVETAFGLNGLGAYLIQAAQTKDLAVVQGISLVLVIAFVVVNVVVDLLYAALDPRVSLGARAPGERRHPVPMGAMRSDPPAEQAGAHPAPADRGPPGWPRRPSIAVATFVAIFGPLLALRTIRICPRHLSLAWVGPTGGHLLGYDFQGRDVLSRLLAKRAVRSMVGPLAVVVILSLERRGIVFAVASAWRRGPPTCGHLVRPGHPVLPSSASCSRCSPPPCSGAGLIAAAIALSVAYMPYVARVLAAARR